MWLKTVTIKNFRSIENVTVNFEPVANVIVGPNAIGKTTLLEAIRLAKATLAPRTPNETQQAFMSLGAISPHNPMQINLAAIVRDISRPLEINATFRLLPDELNVLDSLVPQYATAIVRAGMGPAAMAQGPLALVQYLSSPAGALALQEANHVVETGLPAIKTSALLELNLLINPADGTILGVKQLDQVIFGALEGRLPAHQALFSYFPADRALPSGETVIQIGGPDIAAQLETHNSQPQTKFHRLKPTIVNNFILSELTRTSLSDNFRKIFSKILKNRELAGISINEIGLISITIRELATNRTFDIDGMSSGEKGLILTFLLISHTVCAGGIIMIDEPELHLNPAVCKTILPFLIEEYLVPKGIQAIICSHSPEILGTAFDNPKAALLHIQSPTSISEIYTEDRREVFEALRRLGTSTSDVLFSAGSIFFEGEHDIEIVQAGFDELVGKYNLTQLGGRGSVEKEIRTLQAAEQQNELQTLKCFIFDLDNAPSALRSTKFTKVLQWRRRCIENYLIDGKIIYDILKDPEISKDKIASRGEVAGTLKEIALAQLKEVVSKEIYSGYAFENPGMRPKEIMGKNYEDIADVLFQRLADLKNQVATLDKDTWKAEFIESCKTHEISQEDQWESEWIDLCDGKRFFKDLHEKFGVKVSPLKLKKIIVERMQKENTEAWILIESLLSDALDVR